MRNSIITGIPDLKIILTERLSFQSLRDTHTPLNDIEDDSTLPILTRPDNLHPDLAPFLVSKTQYFLQSFVSLILPRRPHLTSA